MTEHWSEEFTRREACVIFTTWAAQFETWQQAWDACSISEWMIWALDEFNAWQDKAKDYRSFTATDGGVSELASFRQQLARRWSEFLDTKYIVVPEHERTRCAKLRELFPTAPDMRPYPIPKFYNESVGE